MPEDAAKAETKKPLTDNDRLASVAAMDALIGIKLVMVSESKDPAAELAWLKENDERVFRLVVFGFWGGYFYGKTGEASVLASMKKGVDGPEGMYS